MAGFRAARAARVTLAATFASITACDATTSRAERATRQDSAGVEIVQNAAADSAALTWWSIASAPRLEIGKVEAAETEVLFRVVDAILLSDGRIAIASAGNAHVRYYSERGAYLSTSGRQGGGPGEFRRITGMLR